MSEIEQLRERVQQLEGLFALLYTTSGFNFRRNLIIQDGRTIQVGATAGTKIGTAATQKLGFFGASPVVRQNAISAPSGGATVDSQARTAIGTIITTLQTLGLTA